MPRFFLSIDDMETINNRVTFDTNSTTVIVNNSANAHIWSLELDFVPGTLVKSSQVDTSGVMTIGRVYLSPLLSVMSRRLGDMMLENCTFSF